MTKYVLKRLLYMVIVFLLVSLLMYSIYNLIPTDPARAQLEPMKTSLKPAEYEQRYQMLRQQMGLDDPLIVRYLRWIGFWPDVNGKLDGMLQGNFGYSQIYKTDVANVLPSRMLNTIYINIFSTLVALAIMQWVMESIRQGDVDFGIVIDPGPVGDLQCEVILSEPFFLLCHRDSALAVEDYVPWQALQGAKLVLQDYASGSRPLIDAALARNGIQANIVQEIGHPATLFPMVAAGIGISILPALALPLPEGSPLVVKRITPVVERQLMLVRRKNRSLSTAAEALWDVVRDQGNALMAGREGDPLYQI